MKYVDFSDKPISTKQLMLWRLWDALGDLNRARGEMKAAEETAQTAGISAMIYTMIHSQIADLGKTVGELIEDWERKPERPTICAIKSQMSYSTRYARCKMRMRMCNMPSSWRLGVVTVVFAGIYDLESALSGNRSITPSLMRRLSAIFARVK